MTYLKPIPFFAWLFKMKGCYFKQIGLLSRVFANGPGDQGSIAGGVIPKTQKMVLDAALLDTQHYKVRIKGKLKQSRERSSALSYTSCSSYWKGEPLDHPWLRLPNLLTYNGLSVSQWSRRLGLNLRSSYIKDSKI